jgi:hypothetical protein
VSAKEFREYADECLGWAKTAKSDKERKIFLQMAQAWLEAAHLWEAKSPVPERMNQALDLSEQRPATKSIFYRGRHSTPSICSTVRRAIDTSRAIFLIARGGAVQ